MNKEKASKILTDYNFFDKYTYILKVIRSCQSSDSRYKYVMGINAQIWGYDVLNSITDMAMKKYKYRKNDILEIAYPYLENIFRMNIFDPFVK